MIVKTEGSFATIKQSNTDSDLFGTMFAAFPAAVYIEMINVVHLMKLGLWIHCVDTLSVLPFSTQKPVCLKSVNFRLRQ